MYPSSTMIVCVRWKFESAATEFYDSETFEDLLKNAVLRSRLTTFEIS